MKDVSRWGVPIALGDRRILQPGKLRWLRAVAWMVAFTLLIALSFGPAMQAVGDALPKNGPIEFLVRCLGAAIALGAYALLVRYVEDRRPTEIDPKAAPGGLLVGLALGLLMMAAVMAILIGTGLYQFTYTGLAPAWRQASLAIQAGVVEEILVRGIMLRLMWRAFGPAVAFAISAAVFGAGHIVNPNSSWFAVLCIALEAGIMLGAFYALTGRLWVSIGVHIGWNFSQGYLFGAAVSGGNMGASIAKSVALPGHPEWLTGGAFGPEASLPALAVCMAVGAVPLWLAWKEGRFAKTDPVLDAPAAAPEPVVTAH